MDGSPKPAFTALKSLIATLADPGPGVPPQNLQFALVGASSNVHHLLMAKRDGSYYLAFWLEEQGYDVNKRLETPVSPRNSRSSPAVPSEPRSLSLSRRTDHLRLQT